MQNVLLMRFDKSDQGVFGIIYFCGMKRFTGELPDRNNASNISCIPVGDYTVKWTLSNRLKKFTYEILGVPGRGGIRRHSSNLMGDESKGYIAQLRGCISLGEKVGTMRGQKALLISRPAINTFETVLQHQAFLLKVADQNQAVH
jgi:hypothetical protein